MAYGVAWDRAQKHKEENEIRYPCPLPEYVRDKNIQSVAQWCSISFDEAEVMLRVRPARFYRFKGWANAEAEAEAVREDYSKAKSERKVQADAALKNAPRTLGN